MPTFRTLTLALAATALVAGCGTRLNPMNWFGGSRSAPVEAVPAGPVDSRTLVQQVTDLKVERAHPDGAIITATGLPPTQGYWDAALVPQPGTDASVLTYRFVIATPPGPAAVSTPQSREVTAATFVGGKALDEVRQIVVIGATNQRSSGR